MAAMAGLCAAAGAATGTPARAVTIRTLSLPRHATIEPIAARALMTVSSGGTIAATVTLHGFVTRAIVWERDGTYRLSDARGSVAGFDDTGALLVNADRPVRLGFSTRATAVDLTACENFPQSSTGANLAGVLSNGALIATMQSPATVDLDDTSGQNAPVVLHLRSRQCLDVGNGVALATAGLYTAGYVAFINNVPAPSNVVSSRERFTAMRWLDRTREPLGAGVALAINAAGAAVGADVPPGSGAAYGVAPHARYWPVGGPMVELAPDSPRSAAYAIDDRNRITGMLQDTRGRHYAFIVQNGVLHRLDDLVRAPGWRFECGYAFAPDGAVVGIGTFRGIAAAFAIEGS
jgi:hypothetical protein